MQAATAGIGNAALAPCTEAVPGWDAFTRHLRAEVGEAAYENFLARLEVETIANGVARMTVPTAFLRSWLSARYLEVIERLAAMHLPDVRSVSIGSRTSTRRTVPTPPADHGGGRVRDEARPQAPSAPPARDPALRGALVPNYTMATFMEGTCNADAVAAVRRIAEASRPNERHLPLVVEAGSGQGKTHLLQALSKALAGEGRNALYMSAERFMYDFSTVMKDKGAAQTREAIAAIDVLLIDDLQFIQGRAPMRILDETVSAMADTGRPVVLASDRDVDALEHLGERTRSVLASGIIARIGDPDEALRLAILTRRFEDAGRDGKTRSKASRAALPGLAAGLSCSARDLGAAVNRLIAAAAEPGADDADALAAAVVAEMARPRRPRQPRIEDVQRLAAVHFGCDRESMRGTSRTQDVVRPRQIAMYLSKILTDRTLPEIGRRFGGRDHTTVLHAVTKIQKLRAVDAKLDADVDLLVRMLAERRDDAA